MQSKTLTRRPLWVTFIVALCMLLCTSCSREPAPGTIEEMSLVGTVWTGTLSLYKDPSVNVKVGMEFVNDKYFMFSFNEYATEFMKQTAYYHEEEAELYQSGSCMAVDYERGGLEVRCSYSHYVKPEAIQLFDNSWMITDLTKNTLRLVLRGYEPDRAVALTLKRVW